MKVFSTTSQSSPSVGYRIEVAYAQSVDANHAWQAFQLKPEIQVVSWDAQSRVVVLQVTPQITPEMITGWLSEFQLKVISIQPIQN